MYAISLQQINYFLETAERGSVSEASRVLFVAQPTVTKWIRNLETELDVELFIRNSSGMALTEQGRFLYEKWRRLMDDLRLSIEELHAHNRELDEELHIGCLAGYNYDRILPRMTHDFSEKYPNVKISILSYGFKALREMLLGGELDCIFTMTFDLENIPGLSQRIVEEIQVYIAMSVAHPLAKKKQLDLIDIKDELMYIISPDESARGGDKLISTCQRAGFTPEKIRYVPNLPSMAMAIKQGNGVTLCGSEIQKGSEDIIKLYKTKDLPIDAYTIIAWRSKDAGSAALRFVELARLGER